MTEAGIETKKRQDLINEFVNDIKSFDRWTVNIQLPFSSILAFSEKVFCKEMACWTLFCICSTYFLIISWFEFAINFSTIFDFIIKSYEIEKLLEEKHITSEEFARIMAIAPRRLGHLKRGKGYFDTHFLSQVGFVFNKKFVIKFENFEDWLNIKKTRILLCIGGFFLA